MRPIVGAVLLLAGAGAFAPEPTVHTFELWGLLASPSSKNNFYLGFTNGLAMGAGRIIVNGDEPKGQELLECLSSKSQPSRSQAIAMIDKYYKGNPGRWNIPIGQAFFERLTAKGGPCPANQ